MEKYCQTIFGEPGKKLKLGKTADLFAFLPGVWGYAIPLSQTGGLPVEDF